MEASASIEIAKHTLMSCGLILAIGTITGLLAQKIKIPDVAVFLIVGMLIGPEALGLINIKADSALNQIILLFGASYILFDGGASLRFSVLKQVWITIVVIATVGVVMTAAITGIAAYYVLGVPLIVALLLGATLASTDPATLVPIFRQVQHSRPRGPDRGQRVGVQRRHGRDHHLRRAGGGDGDRRILADVVLARSAQAIGHRHRRRRRARISRRAADRA